MRSCITLQELRSLASEDNGWHFRASSTSKWWCLLGSLLDHNASGESGAQKDDEGDESEFEGVFDTGEWGLRPSVKDMRSKRRSAIMLMVRAYYTCRRTEINEN